MLKTPPLLLSLLSLAAADNRLVLSHGGVGLSGSSVPNPSENPNNNEVTPRILTSVTASLLNERLDRIARIFYLILLWRVQATTCAQSGASPLGYVVARKTGSKDGRRRFDIAIVDLSDTAIDVTKIQSL